MTAVVLVFIAVILGATLAQVIVAVTAVLAVKQLQ